MAQCILGKFLGVVCHCCPTPLDVPTFAARCLYVRNDATDPSSERWNYGREICPVILPKFRLPRKFRDRRLYVPSEGRRAEDFFALKIRRFRPGLNPRTWVLKASTLPLDNRSRHLIGYKNKSNNDRIRTQNVRISKLKNFDSRTTCRLRNTLTPAATALKEMDFNKRKEKRPH